MAKIPVLDAIRIIPRDAVFLDRKSGVRGEIFYDKDSNTLRLYSGQSAGGVSLVKADLSNIANSVFLAKSIAAGVGGSSGNFELTIAGDDSTVRTVSSGNVLKFIGSGGISTATTADGEITVNGPNTFSTIAVAGQSNVVADLSADTLTLIGVGIAITTDASTDTITFTGGGGSSNSFATIAVAGQSSVVADSSTDTLTLAAGSGISITTSAGTDTITINNTATGVTTFTGLSDATAAALTVDKIYLPAITMLVVSNNGTSAYRFDQYGNTDDPTIYAINGTTIAFNLQATDHPFLIQDGTGTNYNTGLTHVTTAGIVTTGASAQGKDSGTLYWKIPDSIAGGYRYQCEAHASMVGTISVKNFGSI